MLCKAKVSESVSKSKTASDAYFAGSTEVQHLDASNPA